MQVRAKRMGYFNHKRVKVGQIITLSSEKQFSKDWMEKLDAEGDEAVPKAKGKAKAAKAVEAPEVPAEESVI